MKATWGSAKRAKKFGDHGIDFADLDGFFDGDLVSREDTRQNYGEPRFQSIGEFNGQVVFLVFTPRGKSGEIPHLISARKAEKHERPI